MSVVRSAVTGVGSYLPETIVTNADLAAELKRLRAEVDTLAGTDMPLRDNASSAAGPSGHFETTQVSPQRPSTTRVAAPDIAEYVTNSRNQER